MLGVSPHPTLDPAERDQADGLDTKGLTVAESVVLRVAKLAAACLRDEAAIKSGSTNSHDTNAR